MANPQLATFLDELARRSGRGGDTRLAHINPREETLLRAFGGKGTLNPVTGLREFQYGLEGTEEFDWFGGADEGSSAGWESEWSESSQYYGGDQDEGEPQSQMNIPEPYKSFTSPISTGVGKALIGGGGIAAGLAPIGLMAKGIEMAFGKGEVPEYLPAGVSGVQGGPNQYGLGFGDIGYSPDEPEQIRQRTRQTGVAPTRGQTQRQKGAQRAAPAGPQPLTRPGAMGIPQGLHVPQYMNPLQQRSYIATQGTEGQGAYREPGAQQYWTNLAMRDMLGAGGEVIPGQNMLPIELQYMRNVMGMDAPAEGNQEGLLRALSAR